MTNTREWSSTNGTQPRQERIRKICAKKRPQGKSARGKSVKYKRFALKDALKPRRGRPRLKSDARSAKSAKKSALLKKRPLLPPLLRKKLPKSLNQFLRLLKT